MACITPVFSSSCLNITAGVPSFCILLIQSLLSTFTENEGAVKTFPTCRNSFCIFTIYAHRTDGLIIIYKHVLLTGRINFFIN